MKRNNIAFLLGDGGKVGIFIARLRLTGKGGLKILFGLRAGVGVLLLIALISVEFTCVEPFKIL